MHLEEIACVYYFNDEFLAVNSLELVYRYKKGFYSIVSTARTWAVDLHCSQDDLVVMSTDWKPCDFVIVRRYLVKVHDSEAILGPHSNSPTKSISIFTNGLQVSRERYTCIGLNSLLREFGCRDHCMSTSGFRSVLCSSPSLLVRPKNICKKDSEI